MTPRGHIDAAGTQRRLRALAAIGWTRAQLAGRLGETPAGIGALLRVKTLPPAVAARISAVFDELWDTWPQGPAAGRERANARRKNWPVPMAWDYEPGDPHWIDDPHAGPAEGWQRPAGAQWRTGDLAAEATELITEHGCTRQQAALRLGVTTDAIGKALRRTGSVLATTRTKEDNHHAA
jgi:transcriptional regulator with XRE-family HTH domain